MRKIGCALPLLLLAVRAVADPAPSIRAITASPTEIEIEISGPVAPGTLIFEQFPWVADEHDWPRVDRKEIDGQRIRLPRFDQGRDRLYHRFALEAAGARPPFRGHWVTRLDLQSRDPAPLAAPRGKKGLQSIVDIDDALALGIKQAAHNVPITQIVLPPGSASDTNWIVDGQPVPIHAAGVAALDRTILRLSQAGVINYLIFLNYVPSTYDAKNPLLNPKTDFAKAPNHLGAFHLSSENGFRWYRAAVEFLSHRYSERGRPHGEIAGLIIGNELPSHWQWYNLGLQPAEQVVKEYALAARVADLAARRHHPSLRVFLSFDHFWTALPDPDPLKGIPGKKLIDSFARLVRGEGDFPWNIAYHPYPEDLGNPRTWEDKSARLDFETPRITFKNLEVLPAYLDQPALRYQPPSPLPRSTSSEPADRAEPPGLPRRIILSEQGFHTLDGPEGELLQAAAFAYAFVRMRDLPTVDAFIYHRHVDHAHEGVRLGLWAAKKDTTSTPERKKHLYDVFRQADTPGWFSAFDFARPVISIRDWKEVAPRPTSTWPVQEPRR